MEGTYVWRDRTPRWADLNLPQPCCERKKRYQKESAEWAQCSHKSSHLEDKKPELGCGDGVKRFTPQGSFPAISGAPYMGAVMGIGKITIFLHLSGPFIVWIVLLLSIYWCVQFSELYCTLTFHIVIKTSIKTLVVEKSGAETIAVMSLKHWE